MENKVWIIILLVCLVDISKCFVTEKIFNETFRSVLNRLDNITLQISDIDYYNGRRNQTETCSSFVRIMSQVLFTKLRNLDDTSIKTAEQCNSLTRKYQNLHEKYQKLENSANNTSIKTTEQYKSLTQKYENLHAKNQKLENSANNMSIKTAEQYKSLMQKYENLHEKYQKLENKIRELERCPPGWFSSTDSCYIYVRDEVDWFEAQRRCKKIQAELVEYLNIDEVYFVLNKVKDYRYWGTSDWAGFWVGANDILNEGVFKWIYSTQKISSRSGFAYWLPGQPDRISNDEDCMMTLVNKDGRWNDDQCIRKLSFVCEK